MQNFSAGQVGKGRAIHAVFDLGPKEGETACGKVASATVWGDVATTCKSCLNTLPSWIGYGDALIAAAHEEALIEAGERQAAQEPRELDIWLTNGVVLVDPMLEGDRMVFERWGKDGAEVRNQRTGVLHVVSQSYITTWKYIPRRTDEHQVWRSKATGDLVHIVESRPDAVHLVGAEEGDIPFWLSLDQLAEYFTWEGRSGQ